MSYAAAQQAEQEHRVEHHHVNGLMWSSCSCGWESRKRDSWDNWQATQSRQDGENHQRSEVARAVNKYLGFS
jgi:hypothetical protein